MDMSLIVVSLIAGAVLRQMDIKVFRTVRETAIFLTVMTLVYIVWYATTGIR